MPKRKASEMEVAYGFYVECPTKPTTGPRKGVTDLYDEKDTPEMPELRIDFTISPGSEWNKMRKYRNVKYQDMDFPVGSFIFVNRNDPPPPPPPQDASEELVLTFQRTNMWVGKIQEARAENENKVFLRVFWLYWPEELPIGTQFYHGQQELVLSNHADVVDATTISGPAEISHWNETDEDDERALKALYWRQTYDISKSGPHGKGALSQLRKHCVCRKEYNPDKTMFKCSQETCGIWNHQECLEKDLLAKFKAMLQKNFLQKSLDKKAADFVKEQNERERSLGETIAIGAEAVGSALMNAMARFESGKTENEADISTPVPQLSPKKRGRPPKKTTDERIQVRVRALQGRGHRSGVVVASVKLLPGKGSTADIKEWTIKASCLKCLDALD